MTPHYADDWLTVYHGDARTVMAGMEPESVHCVVTSPPYWGLRDYGTATWVGGAPDCDHSPEQRGGRFATPVSSKQASNAGSGTMSQRNCKCGAVRDDSQLGLEPTPEAYVESMVAVFREVRRVLRSDGTVWLNLGDSYSGSWSGHFMRPEGGEQRPGQPGFQNLSAGYPSRPPNVPGLKPKDLVGIPWRVAFALQADGWYLRSDIIWSKPNPMPESVTDRPTKSHEYLFLLSKSPRYYFDADAVREAQRTDEATFYAKLIKQPHKGQRGKDEVNDRRTTGGFQDATYNPAGRNLRSVWTVATAPYPGAHFATFPPKLIEPCIKAGTSERGVCPECGAPWERIVDVGPEKAGIERGKHPSALRANLQGPQRSANGGLGTRTYETTGWAPSCAHVSPLRPAMAVVLDPFAGSGTTGMVAQSLSRRAVLIDLSMDYLGQLMDRNRDIPLGLGA